MDELVAFLFSCALIAAQDRFKEKRQDSLIFPGFPRDGKMLPQHASVSEAATESVCAPVQFAFVLEVHIGEIISIVKHDVRLLVDFLHRQR